MCLGEVWEESLEHGHSLQGDEMGILPRGKMEMEMSRRAIEKARQSRIVSRYSLEMTDDIADPQGVAARFAHVA